MIEKSPHDWRHITKPEEFEEVALSTFHYQAKHVKIYNQYCSQLGIDFSRIENIASIPFLPISFFKTHEVRNENADPVVCFTSSATGGAGVSKHYLSDLTHYHHVAEASFKFAISNPFEWEWHALLPSYLERSGSSLVEMVRFFMRQHEERFYLYDHDKLFNQIQLSLKTGKKIVLIGVSYALMDFADAYPGPYENLLVIETGGMKGRRKEITKEQLHSFLRERMQGIKICSEYGMTELMSQAYAVDGAHFQTPPWMGIFLREINDPFSKITKPDKTGAVNIIDLANQDSCSFIATDDLGRLNEKGKFEILGRLDGAELRGCNLMVM